MSGTEAQECSRLKVHYDFEYNANDGRRIAIKKDEKLYLVQKTNSDWWKVVRNWDQQSFYVPATYVTEVGARSLLQENFHNKQYDKLQERPVRDQTPKERAAKRKVIEKWLSSTADILQSKDPMENIENQKEYDSVENLSTKEPRDQWSRALIERNFDRDEFHSSRCQPERRNSEVFRKDAVTNKNTLGDPTNTSIKTVSVIYDSSLQMAANNTITELPVLENHNCKLDNHERINHSNESPVKSSYDESNLSLKQRTGSTLRSTSVDFHPAKVDVVNAASSSGKAALKILNDKRKSWAIEELMSELMQLRKEQVDDNKTNFVLRSVQIEDRFDPLEKLTEELHELHASQAHKATVRLAQRGSKTAITSAAGQFFDSDVDHAGNEALSSNVPKSRPPDASTSAEIEVRPREVLAMANKTTLQMSPKISPLKTNSNVPATPANSKLYKCTSKRLDEYEEANILNSDIGMAAGAEVARNDSDNYEALLSPDNESSHRSAYHGHSQLFRSDKYKLDNFEKPSYSNISTGLEGKPKLRPKLKLTIDNIDTKIRLTPSLEKLANEIEFLPANRTSIPDKDKWESSSSKSSSVKVDANDRNKKVNDNQNVQNKLSSTDDTLNVCEEQEMWKSFKSKLTYKGSFKTKEEETGQHDPKTGPIFSVNEIRAKKSNLKKSATFHGGALPDRRKYSFGFDSSESNARRAAVIKAKRRSRSLDNINRLSKSEIRPTRCESSFTSTNVSFDNVQAKPEITSGFTKLRASPDTYQSKIDAKAEITRVLIIPNQSSRTEKEQHAWSDTLLLPSKNHRNINEDIDNLRLYGKNKSTAVSFKNLLCTSDSGSDEYLQYKPFPKSVISKNEREICILDGKPSRRVNQSTESLNNADGSLSERQISSAYISSEALFSQSESEVYAVSDLSDNPSPVTIDDGEESFVRLPPGWRQEYDPESKQICFINSRQEKWFSSNDADGKIYFFEENSNESSWILPSISIDGPNTTDLQNKLENVELRTIRGSSNNDKLRFGKAHSMVVVNQSANKKDHTARRSGSVSQDWPQLRDGNMHILKEGILQKTKITENGKRTRKNWSTSYVVLSELLLLFFKDAKTFTAAMSREPSSAKPEISVDLNGANIEPGGKASSRKNVYIISTALGLQLLIQSDNMTVANEWYQKICGVIGNLPSGPDIDTKSASSLERPIDSPSVVISGTSLPVESKLVSRIGRSRSMKLKRADGSMEDLSGSASERQTNLLKARLKRFFQRRPNMEMLIKNGIYKDEPVFGAYLANVCSRQPPMVPPFVKECIQVLEENPDNMKSDGLYRASGNLSQIQKIRLQVDQNNLDVLKQEEDVHVLAGALKLFFRELKEPLLPYTCFTKALSASGSNFDALSLAQSLNNGLVRGVQSYVHYYRGAKRCDFKVMKEKSKKLRNFREIVQALSPSHYDTLKFLLQHLLRVVTYREYNRMDIQNLAIVFGPTLMWPAVESISIEVDFMQQNLVIECLLSEYDEIFEKRKNEGMLRA